MEAEAPKQAAVAVANEGAGPTGRPGAAARRCVYGHVGGVSGLGVLGCPAVGLESPRVRNSKNLRVHNVKWRVLFAETRMRRVARPWPETRPGQRWAPGRAHKMEHCTGVRLS